MHKSESVFISYAWGGDSEKIVDLIDRTLQKRGMVIIRDKRDLEYKGSIKSFMESIGRGSCVILVISDKYLKSKNCMFELVEISENKQFADRVFPVILSDARIYDPIDRLDYVEYWDKEKAKLNERIKSLSDLSHLQGIREELDNYDRFRDNISRLTTILKDMNTLTPETHQNTQFKDLYNAIENKIRESQTAGSSDVPEPVTTGQKPYSPIPTNSPPSYNFQPVGRWYIQISDPYGSTLLLELYPNGTFQAAQQLGPMGATIQAAGQWIFQQNNIIQMQGLINGFQPFALNIGVQSMQGENSYLGIGSDSYRYMMTRA